MKTSLRHFFALVATGCLAANLPSVSLAQSPDSAPASEAASEDGAERGESVGDDAGPGERGRGGRTERQGGGPMGRMGDPSAMVKMLLQRFDKDSDQKLDEQELVAAFTAMRAQAGGEGGPGFGMGMPGLGGPGFGGPGQGGPQMAARMFDRLDVDGDGKLTGDEIPERMRQGMTRLDANGDGSIERKELEEMMSRMGGPGRRPGGDRPGGDQAPEGNRTPRRPPTE
jgi:hypothetical protein